MSVDLPGFSASDLPLARYDKPLPAPPSRTEAGEGLIPADAVASVKSATPIPIAHTVEPPGEEEVQSDKQREQQTKVMVGGTMTTEKAAKLLGAFQAPTISSSSGFEVTDLQAKLKDCTNPYSFRDRFDVHVAPAFKKYIEAKESGDPKAIMKANIEFSRAIAKYQIIVSRDKNRGTIGASRDIKLQQIQNHLEVEFELQVNGMAEKFGISSSKSLPEKMNLLFNQLKKNGAEASQTLFQDPRGWDVLMTINDFRHTSNNFQFYSFAGIAVKLAKKEPLSETDKEQFVKTFNVIKKTLLERKKILEEGSKDQAKIDKIDAALKQLETLSLSYGVSDHDGMLSNLLIVIEELFGKAAPRENIGADKDHSLEINLSDSQRTRFLQGLHEARRTNPPTTEALVDVFLPVQGSVLSIDLADTLKGYHELDFQNLPVFKKRDFIAAFA